MDSTSALGVAFFDAALSQQTANGQDHFNQLPVVQSAVGGPPAPRPTVAAGSIHLPTFNAGQFLVVSPATGGGIQHQPGRKIETTSLHAPAASGAAALPWYVWAGAAVAALFVAKKMKVL